MPTSQAELDSNEFWSLHRAKNAMVSLSMGAGLLYIVATLFAHHNGCPLKWYWHGLIAATCFIWSPLLVVVIGVPIRLAYRLLRRLFGNKIYSRFSRFCFQLAGVKDE